MEDWRNNIIEGSLIDCLDTDNKWCEGKVLSVHGTTCRIHYIGWSTKYDTSEDVFSYKIQPYHSRTKVWRPYISKGDLVEVLEIRTARKWYVATITGIDNESVVVFYGYGPTERTKTVLIESEEIGLLGTHVRQDQVVFISRNIIDLISECQCNRWQREQQNEQQQQQQQQLQVIVDDSNCCCVCLLRSKNTVLLPCKHMCMCDQCSNHVSLNSCPLCKTRIQLIMKVYT